jgi:hypothetical protein
MDEEHVAAQNTVKAARWDGHLNKEAHYEEYFDDAAKEAADRPGATPGAAQRHLNSLQG